MPSEDRVTIGAPELINSKLKSKFPTFFHLPNFNISIACKMEICKQKVIFGEKICDLKTTRKKSEFGFTNVQKLKFCLRLASCEMK